MRDDWDEFATDDLVVVPISVDSTPTLKEFKAKYTFRSDFLSDFRRDVARLYGVLLEDRFYANRAYFLIDKTGTIRWAHVEENPSEKRSNAELLEQINALRSEQAA
jgi:peroxiredoxin (alkyl hydroperoxide reductase subunit C)